ncbi:hypothetical protein [Promicromonospora soli]|nr:hypothetical protein [Promicromonospora soli]
MSFNLRFAGLIEQPSWWAQYQQDGSEGHADLIGEAVDGTTGV